LSADWGSHVQALVADVELDLDAPLADEDESAC
jgi:hypothetical protein